MSSRKLKSPRNKNIAQSDEMEIVVKDFKGKCHVINARNTNRIYDIKKLLYNESELIPNCKIYYNGVSLNDNDEVIDCELNNHCIIDVLNELRGGMQIFVKTIKGETFTFEVLNAETVSDIKNKICEKSGIAPKSQKLVFCGAVLQDGETLQQLKITSQSVLNLVTTVGEDMQILARISSTKTETIGVQKNNTILEVKGKIQESTGIRVKQQTLLFDSTTLQDDRTLNSYYIRGNDIISVASEPQSYYLIYLVFFSIVILIFFDFTKWVS